MYIYLLTKFECVLSVDADLDNIGKYNRKLGRYINYRGIRKLIFEAFKNCSIKEYKAFSSLLINWKKEIVNSFIESRNRQIGSLIYNANGLSNFRRTRNRIMYCINKNDTYSI